MRESTTTDDLRREANEIVSEPTTFASAYEMASSPATKPADLVALCFHGDPIVRSAIARHRALPLIGRIILAGDRMEQVQALASEQIPDSLREAAKAGQTMASHIFEALESIVNNKANKLRLAIAETAVGLPNVPRDFLLRLARTHDEILAAVVLEFASTLSDSDVLEVIQLFPTSQRLVAIARRRNLSADLAAAIAESRDSAAIVALLKNKSAMIRENTLSQLVEMSRKTIAWQGQIASHPRLSARLARRMADFVADKLIAEMAARTDFDADTIAFLKVAAVSRLARPARDRQGVSPAYDRSVVSLAYDRALQLNRQGRLSDRSILDSATPSITPFAVAALAVKSQLAIDTAILGLSRGRPMDIVALCWAAGFTAIDAENIQRSTGLICEAQVVRATSSGWYANTEAELSEAIRRLTDASAKI